MSPLGWRRHSQGPVARLARSTSYLNRRTPGFRTAPALFPGSYSIVQLSGRMQRIPGVLLNPIPAPERSLDAPRFRPCALRERILLILAVQASASWHGLTVLRRIRPMRVARGRNLECDGFARRLWTVFVQVVPQTTEGSASGLRHALVMWGFYAFARVRLEHFAAGPSGLEAGEAGKCTSASTSPTP